MSPRYPFSHAPQTTVLSLNPQLLHSAHSQPSALHILQERCDIYVCVYMISLTVLHVYHEALHRAINTP